jgi:hypothetical protein
VHLPLSPFAVCRRRQQRSRPPHHRRRHSPSGGLSRSRCSPRCHGSRQLPTGTTAGQLRQWQTAASSRMVAGCRLRQQTHAAHRRCPTSALGSSCESRSTRACGGVALNDPALCVTAMLAVSAWWCVRAACPYALDTSGVFQRPARPLVRGSLRVAPHGRTQCGGSGAVTRAWPTPCAACVCAAGCVSMRWHWTAAILQLNTCRLAVSLLVVHRIVCAVAAGGGRWATSCPQLARAPRALAVGSCCSRLLCKQA